MKFHYFRAIVNENCGTDKPLKWKVVQEGWLNGSSRTNQKRCSEQGCNAVISLTTMCAECLRSKHNLEVKLSEHLNRGKKPEDWRGYGLYAVKPKSGPYRVAKRGARLGEFIVFSQRTKTKAGDDIIVYRGDKLTPKQLGTPLSLSLSSSPCFLIMLFICADARYGPDHITAPYALSNGQGTIFDAGINRSAASYANHFKLWNQALPKTMNTSFTTINDKVDSPIMLRASKNGHIYAGQELLVAYSKQTHTKRSPGEKKKRSRSTTPAVDHYWWGLHPSVLRHATFQVETVAEFDRKFKTEILEVKNARFTPPFASRPKSGLTYKNVKGTPSPKHPNWPNGWQTALKTLVDDFDLCEFKDLYDTKKDRSNFASCIIAGAIASSSSSSFQQRLEKAYGL